MMHSEHGLSMPYVICDVPDQAFGSGGILVQVVRQSLSRIERARSGGLEYGSRTIVLDSVKQDAAGRPHEDIWRGLTATDAPIRILMLIAVSITAPLFFSLELTRDSSDLCIDISLGNSVLVGEGQAFFFIPTQSKCIQLWHSAGERHRTPWPLPT